MLNDYGFGQIKGNRKHACVLCVTHVQCIAKNAKQSQKTQSCSGMDTPVVSFVQKHCGLCDPMFGTQSSRRRHEEHEVCYVQRLYSCLVAALAEKIFRFKVWRKLDPA